MNNISDVRSSDVWEGMQKDLLSSSLNIVCTFSHNKLSDSLDPFVLFVKWVSLHEF